MSLPVFLSDDDLTAGRVALRGTEGRHAADVRRIAVGEQVQLVDGRGTRATGTVVAVVSGGLDVEVAVRVREEAPVPRIVLAQALAKGERGELAVELATEVGVDEVVPWAAERCVVRWEGERGERARARWASAAREAAKQSRRAWVPEVGPAVSTRELAARLAGTRGLVLHEAAAGPLTEEDLAGLSEVVLVVGPEGGIGSAELAVLEAAGGRPVRLGPTVLRTSTAGAVAVAALSVRLRRW